MAYSKVTTSTLGTKSIRYAFGPSRYTAVTAKDQLGLITGSHFAQGHNGSETRNQLVGTVNLLPGARWETQMGRYWSRARAGHKVQLVQLILSWSKRELDPDDPDDLKKALDISLDMVREHYPDRQALCFVQTDGEGGCVHAHILINDVSMTDYKGCDQWQRYHPQIMKWNDEITARYTQLDNGLSEPDKNPHWQRVRRAKGEYVYQDDIKARVKAAMVGAADEAEFRKRLAAAGVTYEAKDSKKYGDYYVYDLDKATLPEGASVPGRERLKARSYKLGADYGPEALQAVVEAARNARAASGKPGGAQAGGHGGKDQDEARERARRQAEACRKDAEEAAREFKSFDAAQEAMKRLGKTLDSVERYRSELEDDDEDDVTKK